MVLDESAGNKRKNEQKNTIQLLLKLGANSSMKINMKEPNHHQSAPDGKKWALLIGVGSFLEDKARTTENSPEFKNLEGPVNDVTQMELILRRKNIDFESIQILLSPLRDPRYRLPTYNNIIEGLIYLTNAASPGDVVYIYYSGMTLYAPTAFPNLKGEGGKDGVLLPADIHCGGKYLRGIELDQLLGNMVKKGLLVTLILDGPSFFSSPTNTSSRKVTEWKRPLRQGLPELFGGTGKFLPQDTGDAESGRGSTEDGSWHLEPRGYTVFAACLPHEYPREILVRGKGFHGVVTASILWILSVFPETSLKNMSAWSFYTYVCKKLQGNGLKQTPVFFGDGNRLFLSASTITPQFEERMER